MGRATPGPAGAHRKVGCPVSIYTVSTEGSTEGERGERIGAKVVNVLLTGRRMHLRADTDDRAFRGVLWRVVPERVEVVPKTDQTLTSRLAGACVPYDAIVRPEGVARWRRDRYSLIRGMLHI